MAHFEADVPEKGQKPLDVRLPVGRVALRQQHHDVDVGARVQLAAAVAAHGDQRQIVRKLAGVPYPGRAQRDVDQARTVAHQILDRFVRVEALLEQFGAAVQYLAKCDGGELAFLERLRARPSNRASRRLCRETCRAAFKRLPRPAGRAGARRALKVSTSKPSSGDQDGVLPLCRQRLILGDHGPAVGEQPHVAASRH